jgi:two-component system C4-dicarboxylate transport sensor histidine kinase DctB
MTKPHLIAGAFKEYRLVKALQPWQAQNLAGQLVSSMIHEVDNKLGGIKFQVDVLQERIRELQKWPEKAEDATFLFEIEHSVEKIAEAQHEAGRLRGQYLGLAAIDELRLVDLNTLTQDMVNLLNPMARLNSIVLISRLVDNLPPVQARPSQLRQIFLNLMLNAIQQMAQLGRQGSVTIEVSHCPWASRPIQVRFIDEGPGVHAQLWERIFDFGFTTKKGGVGLGLTISRQAASDLGGELRVEESHILWGTTFLLELPKGA